MAALLNLEGSKPVSPPKACRAEHFSQAVLIACGDYRLAPFIRKYIKRIFDILEMDILTNAGGSRAISGYMVGRKSDGSALDRAFYFFTYGVMERLFFLIKKIALYLDLNAYLAHNAKTIVVAGHSSCGFWPSFNSAIEEHQAHIESILYSGKKLRAKYPGREIILLYLIIDMDTQKAYKVVEIDIDTGNTKEIIVEEEDRLL